MSNDFSTINNCCCRCCRCIIGATGVTGPTGLTGPIGPVGPIGPTGAIGISTQLRGIQAQLFGSSEGTITNDSAVLFNTVLNNQSPAISYNSITGEFTINSTGNYDVTWWVATDGAATSSNVSFAVIVNGAGGILGFSPLVTGQLNGSALITISSIPSVVTLANVSIATVTYATTPVQANIIITQVTF